MSQGKIYVAGIGPGNEDDITPAVMKIVALSDVVVGYKYYFSFIRPFVKEGAECVDTGMRRERDRAAMAFDYAAQGKEASTRAGQSGAPSQTQRGWVRG